MRFRTIWTLPGATLKEKLSRTRDWLAQKWSDALPLRVRYWVTIGSIGTATMKYEGPIMDIPLGELMEHIPKPKNMS